MNKIIYIICVFAFLLIGCKPKVDCTNRNTYRDSLAEIAQYYAESSPKDAEQIATFARKTLEYGNLDMQICSYDSEALRHYVRIIGNKNSPMTKTLEK